MADLRNRIYDSLKLGAWVTAAVFLLNTILSWGKIEVIQLFGKQPVTGITTTLGNKVIDVINSLNLVDINISSIVLTFISAVIISLVGIYLYDWINLPAGLSGWKRIAAILFWGTLVFGFLLVWGFKIPAASILVMLIVYYIAAAFVTGLLQTYAPKLIGSI